MAALAVTGLVSTAAVAAPGDTRSPATGGAAGATAQAAQSTQDLLRGKLEQSARARRSADATRADTGSTQAAKVLAKLLRSRQFTLVSAPGEYQNIDLGPAGAGPGDQILGVEPLYDPSGKILLGQLSAICTQLPLLGPDDPEFVELRCSFAFEFLKGTSRPFQIYTEGEYQISDLFPILGGTGPYSAVRGQVKISSQADKQGRFTYTFTLR
jgi:hypothetical protein